VVEQRTVIASARGLGRWLARIAPRTASGLVTVAILPDAKVKTLNKRFRGIDEATDVLSFPAERGQTPGQKKGSDPFLGDIVIAHGVARKQARDLGHSITTELRVLALHGLLHLLGYDHEVDRGRMARMETRLRRRAGLPLGLIARSS
jgi:probable rRNA maturation factor